MYIYTCEMLFGPCSTRYDSSCYCASRQSTVKITIQNKVVSTSVECPEGKFFDGNGCEISSCETLFVACSSV